jgi:AcrR family transcriptional regulator
MATTNSGLPATAVPRALRSDAQRNAERVLAAAREVFAERGPDASLEEIARRAGVGIGTLYRHYPNRQALVAAVFRDDVDAARARADELLRADDPDAAFTIWLREQLEQAGSCQALGASVMISMLDDDPELSPCAAMRAGGAALLARGQAGGVLRPDVTIDDLLRLVSAIAIATDDAVDGREQVERLFGLVMDAVRV